MLLYKSLLVSASCLLTCRARALTSLSNPTTTATSPSSVLEKSSLVKPAHYTRLPTKLTTTADNVPRGGDDADFAPNNPLLNLPTLKQYRKFALPCLGLWVAGPLLSLVDTAFVGVTSSAAGNSAQQLAALGPATTFFDGATYLFAFLNVATTNLYSSALAQNNDDPYSTQAQSVVRTASRVALNCGFGIMIFLMLTCRPLLQLYIGNKAASTPGLLDAATDYVKIRALSLPTSLLLGVLQSSLLGAKDSVTPLIAIVWSTVVNVIGDFILVKCLGMGLRGASIATTVAQWASTLALLGPARKKLVKDHSLGLLWTNKKEYKTKDGVTGRTFLAFAAPVLTLILGKLAAFGFMTHSAAAVPGQPTPLASHQIVLSLLFFCSPFLEVISQTAQTFLPAYITPVQERVALLKEKTSRSRDIVDYDIDTDKTVQPWLQASYSVSTTLLKLGMITAGVIASLASLIPAYFCYFLTSDISVQQAVKPLAKYLWMGAFFWAPVAVSEGVLLARRELNFLAGVYLVSTILLPPALLRIKNQGGTVAQVWACFAAFQLFRAICFTIKIWGGRLAEQSRRQRKQRVAAVA